MKPTIEGNDKWWWGYLDDQGVIYVKRYKGDWDIQKVEQLPFCRGIFNPFKAHNRHEAQMMIARWLTEQQYQQTRYSNERN